MQEIRRKLNHLSLRLAAFPSVAYATLYMLTFMAFALIYTKEADLFGHSALVQERARAVSEAMITAKIEPFIQQSLRSRYVSDPPIGNDWRLSRAVKVLRSRVTEQGVMTLRIAVRCEREPDEVANISSVLRLQPLTTYRPAAGRIQLFDITPEAFPDVSRWGIERDRVLDVLFGANAMSGPRWSIPTTERVVQEMKMLEDRAEGRATPGSWETFVRMTYFSAVTITTTGFGDIFPVSTLARALVATESLLGVVLIGLFLNSIFHEASRGAR
jgi:Ion channel